MKKKRKQLPILNNVKIVDIAVEGKAIAKVEDEVIFIPYAVPGDIVNIQLTKKRRRYSEGKPIEYLEYSKDRVEAFCEHFGTCGGCKWQMLNYKEQLKYKQKQVEDNLTRIAKVDLPAISLILASPQTEFYRNKLEFTFSDKKWLTTEQISSGKVFDDMNALGFHIPGMFDKVLNINKCWLQTEESNDIRAFVKEFCTKNGYSFFNIREKSGLMRNLMIRTSSTGELMVIVIFFEDDKEKREKLLSAIGKEFPVISSLLYIINQKANDTIGDQEILTWSGTDYIYEEMEGLRFKIGPKSFYQTNSEQAYHLYGIAREYAGLTGEELVYDLYTGTGTIANFVAKDAKKVIGIEYVEEAIEDARFNSRNNKIENTLFYAGDMKDILTDNFISEHGRPDVIITDPPRAGMHGDVVTVMLRAEPKKIVYVSCNPATQSRDLALLDEKYRITRVQPVDMFPHTHHVENVVLLEKR